MREIQNISDQQANKDRMIIHQIIEKWDLDIEQLLSAHNTNDLSNI